MVQSEYAPWEWDDVRRAGVSSFGVGGTNVHVVVEEAPAVAAAEITDRPPGAPVVGPNPEALRDAARRWPANSARPEALDLSDVAFTLDGRRKEKVRMAAVVHDQQDAATVLRARSTTTFSSVSAVGDTASGADRVVLLFPGQGRPARRNGPWAVRNRAGVR